MKTITEYVQWYEDFDQDEKYQAPVLYIEAVTFSYNDRSKEHILEFFDKQIFNVERYEKFHDKILYLCENFYYRELCLFLLDPKTGFFKYETLNKDQSFQKEEIFDPQTDIIRNRLVDYRKTLAYYLYEELNDVILAAPNKKLCDTMVRQNHMEDWQKSKLTPQYYQEAFSIDVTSRDKLKKPMEKIDQGLDILNQYIRIKNRQIDKQNTLDKKLSR